MHDELDRILDEGLRTYAAEPRAGLAGRIQARAGRRRAGWWWAVPVAAVAAGVMVWVRVPEAVPPPAPVAMRVPPRQVFPPVVRKRAPRVVVDRPLLGGPPSREELVLAKLAREHPEVFADWQEREERAAAPLVVEELKISPIVVRALDGF